MCKTFWVRVGRHVFIMCLYFYFTFSVLHIKAPYIQTYIQTNNEYENKRERERESNPNLIAMM